MHLPLILPIAIILTLMAACLPTCSGGSCLVLTPANVQPEWLDGFSLESYAPMDRLLGKDDAAFLASQPGYRPEIARRLMAERRKIFAAYLGHLERDFNLLVGIGKLMVVYSTVDRQEFALRLWRQQVRFYAGVCSLRLQLALYPLSWGGGRNGEEDVRRLVAAAHGHTRSGGNVIVARPVRKRLAADGLEMLLGFFEQRELLFCFLKFGGMHATARAPVLHGKTQVQHLVEQNIFHG